MTQSARRILSAVATYRKKFAEMKIGKVSIPASDRAVHIVGREHKLAYCHSLLDDIEAALSQGMTTPASEWLGRVQGVLWDEHVYTWDQIESHGTPATA